MGDPRKIRRKYTTPKILWDKSRISVEKKLIKEYGFKNKAEIWKVNSILETFKDQAKKIIRTKGEQADIEQRLLINKLAALGLLEENATPDEVLALKQEDLMERRLQTLVYRKGMARSIKQSRQFIVHGHIMVGDKKITSPSYLVTVNEESQLKFAPKSTLSNPEHPERAIEAKKIAAEKEKISKKESEVTTA